VCLFQCDWFERILLHHNSKTRTYLSAMKICIKSADISHPTRAMFLHLQWTRVSSSYYYYYYCLMVTYEASAFACWLLQSCNSALVIAYRSDTLTTVALVASSAVSHALQYLLYCKCCTPCLLRSNVISIKHSPPLLVYTVYVLVVHHHRL
jgi:hypothetical protein